MEREQAREIMLIIHKMYGTKLFNDKQVVEMWLGTLMKHGDYERTKEKLNNHVLTNKFAPKLSEVLGKEVKMLDIEKMKQEELEKEKLIKTKEEQKKREAARKKLAKLKEHMANGGEFEW